MRYVALIIILIPLMQSLSYAGDDLLHYLQNKKVELEMKDRELKAKEKELQGLEMMINKKIRRDERILAEMDNILKKIEREKKERMDLVVKTYEKMDPGDAAVRLEDVRKRLVVRILSNMKARKAAKILSLMDPERAAGYTEEITRIQGLEKVVGIMNK